MTRKSNIKSHGVFVSQNGNDEEAVLSSEDLYYLADQLDVLDQTIQGLTLQANASIEYTYHTHKTGDGIESYGTLYSTDAPGGCYVPGGHTHNKTGTCPSGYTYHVHTSTCSYTETYLGEYKCTSRYNGTSYFKCNHCGHETSNYDGGASQGWGIGHCHHCSIKNYSCSGVLNAGYTYYCGSPTNTWVLGCGKSTSTIDEAHIVFN